MFVTACQDSQVHSVKRSIIVLLSLRVEMAVDVHRLAILLFVIVLALDSQEETVAKPSSRIHAQRIPVKTEHSAHGTES